MRKIYLLLTTHCLLLLISCKAPRDNPYDPQSPEYEGERVKGKVTNRVGVPLVGALISTIPVKYAGLTDSTGSFTIMIEPGVWKVVVSYTGYAPETTKVEVKLGETKEIGNFLLNGIPLVQSTSVVSTHQHEVWPLPEIYWADVEAEIYDPDGIQDIDSVWLTVDFDTLILKSYLSYKEGKYVKRIYGDSCPGGKLESLIGRPFRIHAMDKELEIGSSGAFFLPRIIHSLPHPIKPTYLDTLSPSTSIDFVWTRIKATHPLLYKLVIFYQATLDTVIVKSNIVDTTIKVESLRPSLYLWRVQGEDEFGNISRSKSMSFTVKDKIN